MEKNVFKDLKYKSYASLTIYDNLIIKAKLKCYKECDALLIVDETLRAKLFIIEKS